MKVRKKNFIWQLAVMLIVVAPAVNGQQVSVDDYISAYVDARDVTIEGVRDRLRLLQQGVSAQSTYIESAAENQQRVSEAYSRYRFTPSRHVAFGTQHAEEILSWLKNNPDVQKVLDEQDGQLTDLSNQIRTLSEDN